MSDRPSSVEIRSPVSSYESIPSGSVPASSGWPQPGIATETPTAPGGGLHRYVSAIRRRGLMAILIGLPIGALAAAAMWYSKPEKYTATAVLRLSPTDKTMIFQTADAESQGGQTFGDYKRTQRLLLRSRFVITQALRDEQLAKLPQLQAVPDPVAWLEQNLAVNYPDDAEIMMVSLAGPQQDGLHQLVNGIVNSYFEDVVFEERKHKAERLNELELTRQKFDSRLRNRRTELKQLVERVGDGPATKLTIEQQNAVDRYSALRSELTSVQMELMYLGLAGKGAPRDSGDDAVLLQDELRQVVQNDPESMRLTAEKEQFERYMAEVKAKLTPQAAAVKARDHNQRLEDYDRKLQVREEQLRVRLVAFKKRMAATKEGAENRQLTQLKAQEQHLIELLTGLENEVRVAQPSTDVEMMRIDTAVLQDVVQKIAAEIERTKVELQPDSKGTTARVRELSKALPAQKVDTQAKLKSTAGAGLAGLLFPLILFVWLDARKDRIYTKDEVTGRLGLSVIGAVPLVPPRIMRKLGGRSSKAVYWRARLSESVDSIAAVLVSGAKSRGLKIVMVSSSNAGEGKTTLAANLATSLAGSGCRTALIDFDLRRPALHRVFDLPFQPGVCDVLRDPQELDASLQVTQIPNLHFLPAGRCGTTGLAKLSGDRLKSLFSSLRSDFDFVVVDGSPILPVVDASLIAQHVDTVVLSVLSDFSRVGQVRAACHHLEHFGVPILGVVMIGSKRDAYPEAYQDYHSHAAYAGDV